MNIKNILKKKVVSLKSRKNKQKNQKLNWKTKRDQKLKTNTMNNNQIRKIFKYLRKL